MDGYSRLVAFLKVLLPLTALGLLSTLFLLSRSVDPTTTIPFGEAEITERLQKERITAPYFSGTTSGGDQVIFTATSANPGTDGGLAQANDLTAKITLSGGGTIELSSETGSFDPRNDLARFVGSVEIKTATGYVLTTEALQSRVENIDARSDGPVQGHGPLGQLQAGQLVLTSQSGANDTHLLFKNGVKLVYDPKIAKDNP